MERRNNLPRFSTVMLTVLMIASLFATIALLGCEDSVQCEYCRSSQESHYLPSCSTVNGAHYSCDLTDNKTHELCGLCDEWMCHDPGKEHGEDICNALQAVKDPSEETGDESAEESSSEPTGGTDAIRCPNCQEEREATDADAALCGTEGHYTCDGKDHSKLTCNHYACAGGSHEAAGCGTAGHYVCDGKDHSKLSCDHHACTEGSHGAAGCGTAGHYVCDGKDHSTLSCNHYACTEGSHGASGCGTTGHYVCDGEDHSKLSCNHYACTEGSHEAAGCGTTGHYVCDGNNHEGLGCGHSVCAGGSHTAAGCGVNGHYVCSGDHSKLSCGHYACGLLGCGHCACDGYEHSQCPICLNYACGPDDHGPMGCGHWVCWGVDQDGHVECPGCGGCLTENYHYFDDCEGRA